MGKQETVIAEGESIKEFFEVRHADAVHLLELAQSEEQLAEAKVLDDLAFGEHQGISMEELTEIALRGGAVLLLRDDYGRLIGETQIITNPIPQHKHYLGPDEAYNYGVAVHPDLQNSGTAQILLVGQEKIAVEAGKSRSKASVRLENGQSIRSHLKAGYRVVDYHPEFYGTVEENGARLVIEKGHNNPYEVMDTEIIAGVYHEGRIPMATEKNLEGLIRESSHFIGIPVYCGDRVDLQAHRCVSAIIYSGFYHGVGILKDDEAMLSKNVSLLIMRRR